MNGKRFAQALGSTIGGLLFALALLLLLSSASAKAESVSPSAGVLRFVSVSGNDTANDCTSNTTPCRTVQYAMNLAQDEDEIRVAAGTYTGTMVQPDFSFFAGGVTATVFISKNVSALLGGYAPDFSSRNPLAYETILNASAYTGTFVIFISNTTTLIDGFTLTGATGAFPGDGSQTFWWGGAIRIQGGAPTLSNNKIQNNIGLGRGGGIFNGGVANSTIANNLIYSNTVDEYGGGIYVGSGTVVITGNTVISNIANVEGGGIYAGWNAPVSILSNTIAYNQVISPTEGRGGGISAWGDTTVVIISHNEIYSNSMVEGIEGSGIMVGAPAIIDGNYIHHNYGEAWRSALCVADTSSPITLTNNVVANNSGSGIRAINFQTVSLINNTVAENTYRGIEVFFWPLTSTVPYTATIYNNIVVNNGECGINGEQDANLLIDYNDVLGHTNDYCGFATAGIYDISSDPLFVNSIAGNYRLAVGSPAVNTGISVGAPAFDRDGVARPQGSGTDMGAYEFVYNQLYLPLIRR